MFIDVWQLHATIPCACVCVKLFQFATGGNWASLKGHASACIQSFLEAFSLFLVFSAQTKPKETLHLNVSHSKQQQQKNNISKLKYTFLIQIGLIIFLFLPNV